MRSCLTVRPHRLKHSSLPCPWGFPGRSTGASCQSLARGVVLTQGLNLHLLYWQACCFTTEPPGKPWALIDSHSHWRAQAWAPPSPAASCYSLQPSSFPPGSFLVLKKPSTSSQTVVSHSPLSPHAHTHTHTHQCNAHQYALSPQEQEQSFNSVR